jgi:alpha-galactosidase/6-phospho-beta-glucosidase family protein
VAGAQAVLVQLRVGGQAARQEQREGQSRADAVADLEAELLRICDVQVVDLRNDGALPFLPDEAIIEVPARIGADGPTAMPVRPVEPLLAGLIAQAGLLVEANRAHLPWARPR